jgi:hypothetical protein
MLPSAASAIAVLGATNGLPAAPPIAAMNVRRFVPLPKKDN